MGILNYCFEFFCMNGKDWCMFWEFFPKNPSKLNKISIDGGVLTSRTQYPPTPRYAPGLTADLFILST